MLFSRTMCPRKAACWVEGACDTLGSPVPPVSPDPNSPEDSVALEVKVESILILNVVCYLEVGTKEE